MIKPMCLLVLTASLICQLCTSCQSFRVLKKKFYEVKPKCLILILIQKFPYTDSIIIYLMYCSTFCSPQHSAHIFILTRSKGNKLSVHWDDLQKWLKIVHRQRRMLMLTSSSFRKTTTQSCGGFPEWDDASSNPSFFKDWLQAVCASENTAVSWKNICGFFGNMVYTFNNSNDLST